MCHFTTVSRVVFLEAELGTNFSTIFQRREALHVSVELVLFRSELYPCQDSELYWPQHTIIFVSTISKLSLLSSPPPLSSLQIQLLPFHPPQVLFHCQPH